jgi:ABC-type microcin C transport system permease subunit YejB
MDDADYWVAVLIFSSIFHLLISIPVGITMEVYNFSDWEMTSAFLLAVWGTVAYYVLAFWLWLVAE